MNQHPYYHASRLLSTGSEQKHGINASSYNNFTLNYCLDYINRFLGSNNSVKPNLLDIGCGWGGLGRKIRSLTDRVRLTGLEQDQLMSSVAGLFYDEIIESDIETLLNNQAAYDVLRESHIVVMSDILEHTYDPWLIYKQVSDRVMSGSVMIISLPCITNLASLKYMYSHGFSYRRSGIFDFTHQRFFSPDDILAMVQNLTSRPYEVTITRNVCPDSLNLLHEDKTRPANSNDPLRFELFPSVHATVRFNSEQYHKLTTRGLVLAVSIK